MVKRIDETAVSLGSSALSEATGDTVKKSVKKDQAWRYPGGVITRASHLGGKKTSTGAAYTDDKSPGEGRRKQESNLLITLNTNRSIERGGPMADAACKAAQHALDKLAQDSYICTYLKFGPKSKHYQHDKYDDVIEKIDWKAAVEVGENLNRVHTHIWMTITHYSQVQINMPVMQHLFKQLYNQKAKELDNAQVPPFTSYYEQICINKRPYINVKLLPESNWAMVIKQYIHKAMTA